jgi:glycosyltransferase involved in cell wall biosynthesis
MNTRARVDFHLHSYASNVTTFYAANVFSIPESYSEPRKLYQMLRERGMSLVTLTDHNSVDGVRELLDAGLPDVFMSAEMSCRFPEDGCVIHVTIANVTEEQFREVNRLRSNIYEAIAYLDAQIASEATRADPNRIAYFMTHPFVSTENRPCGREGALSVEHIEKALLLCNCFEVHNGSRSPALHDLTARFFARLDRVTIERLANRHDLAAKGETPWCKTLLGGSDDHAGINPGRTFTEFAAPGGKADPNALILAIRSREVQPGGAHGGPITLANSILKLAYEGSVRGRTAPARGATRIGGPVQDLLRIVFDGSSRTVRGKMALALRRLRHRLVTRWKGAPAAGASFDRALRHEMHELLFDRRWSAELKALGSVDDRIFLVVDALLNRLFSRYAAHLRDLDALGFVGTVKEAVALAASSVCVAMPYLAAFLQHATDTHVVRAVRKRYELDERPRLVLVTDTFFEINGVSATIKRMIAEARRRGVDFTVVTCVRARDRARLCGTPEISELIAAGRLQVFTSVASADLPRYQGMYLHFPPFLELLRFLQEGGFTKMQISTPGTMGLCGLLAAKTLQMETASTYHTAIPEYVEHYTRDITLEALAWRYLIEFYFQVDEVLVPSRFVARLLHKRGLRNQRLLTLDRWVDVERFHPSRRVEGYWDPYLPRSSDFVKFVYVGRLGVEKNLDVLAQAYRLLRKERPEAHLIIIGDGPYRAQLETLLSGLPVTFTGFLQGDELARAIASADAKVFPSTTDTWGNAPLEAQASGLPVVVSDIGGPAELMRDGVTGFCVRGRDPRALHDAMQTLMDPTTREQMGRAARRFAEANRVDEPYMAIFDSAEYRRRARAVPRVENEAAASAAELGPALVALPLVEVPRLEAIG